MPARHQREVMTAPGPCDGRLSPWAGAVTDAPGWQITTASRRLAGAVTTTIPGATIHPHEKGEWQARIPQAVLKVVVIDADNAGALRCRLSAHPNSGVFALAFAPWPTATVLKCPLAALPAQGRIQGFVKVGVTVCELLGGLGVADGGVSGVPGCPRSLPCVTGMRVRGSLREADAAKVRARPGCLG